MISCRIRFLLVDDYSNIRNTVKDQLRYFGFKGDILEAENVDQAIGLLESLNGPGSSSDAVPVDFIVSDWNMPKKTGLDFLKWARAQDYLKQIPFLLLTTESEKEKIVDAITAGASNYLIKPWTKREFSEKIAHSWNKSYPLGHARNPAPPSSRETK